MKFLIASSLLAASVSAEGLFSRDLDTIKAVLSTVGNNLGSLDTAAKAFNGNPQDLLSAANTLTASLDDGKAKIDPTGELSLGDAIGLQGPVGDLQKQGDALLADFKAVKDKIAAAGLCTITFDQVSTVNKKSNDLINSIVSKVPAAAQGIAQNLSAGLIKDLQEAQDAFSPANCQNTGGGGGSSPTTSAPGQTSSAPGTPTITSAPGVTSPTVVVPTTTATTPGGGGGGDGGDCSCPAAQTVTVTVIDSAGCNPPATTTTSSSMSCPTCTTPTPVTTTTTQQACPAPAKRSAL